MTFKDTGLICIRVAAGDTIGVATVYCNGYYRGYCKGCYSGYDERYSKSCFTTRATAEVVVVFRARNFNPGIGSCACGLEPKPLNPKPQARALHPKPRPGPYTLNPKL